MTQQTAVEWFFEQLTEVDYGCINKTFLQNNNSLAGYKLRELFKQAKEMEKEQRINAQMDMFHHLNELPFGMQYLDKKDSAEQFCETYGNKGSDDINTLTSNPVDYQNHSNMSDNFKQFSLYEHKETIATADTSTSSQTEISDEEIEKIAKEHVLYNESKRNWVVEGMKLYREQLKRKQ